MGKIRLVLCGFFGEAEQDSLGVYRGLITNAPDVPAFIGDDLAQLQFSFNQTVRNCIDRGCKPCSQGVAKNPGGQPR